MTDMRTPREQLGTLEVHKVADEPEAYAAFQWYSHSCDFQIWFVDTNEMDGTPLFGNSAYQELTYSPEIGNASVTGFCKWDGCRDLEGLDRHYCGNTDMIRKLFVVMCVLEKAKQLIPNSDDGLWA